MYLFCLSETDSNSESSNHARADFEAQIPESSERKYSGLRNTSAENYNIPLKDFTLSSHSTDFKNHNLKKSEKVDSEEFYPSTEQTNSDPDNSYHHTNIYADEKSDKSKTPSEKLDDQNQNDEEYEEVEGTAENDVINEVTKPDLVKKPGDNTSNPEYDYLYYYYYDYVYPEDEKGKDEKLPNPSYLISGETIPTESPFDFEDESTTTVSPVDTDNA